MQGFRKFLKALLGRSASAAAAAVAAAAALVMASCNATLWLRHVPEELLRNTVVLLVARDFQSLKGIDLTSGFHCSLVAAVKWAADA